MNLKKDYFWNTLGVLLQSLISPLLLIIITRINGIDDSGLFSFTFSIAIMLWTFGMWGGRTYQVSDVKNVFSNKSYIVVRIVLAFGMLLIALLFALANQYDAMKTGVLILLVATKAFESVADAFYGVMQTHDRLYKSGISLVMKALLGFAVFLIMNILTKDIVLSTLSLMFVSMLVFVLYDIPIANSLENLGIKLTSLKHYLDESGKILRVCFPIFIIAFLSAFSLNIPRYFIDSYYNQDIGYFGIIAMPVTLVALMIMFIMQPNIVRLAELYHVDRVGYRALVMRIAVYTITVGVVITAGTAILGVPVLDTIFGGSFGPYYLAMLVIVAGGVVNALVSVLVNIMIIMRSLRPQMYILFFTNILLAILSCILIPTGGINVAAGLFLFTNIIQLIAMVAVYRNVLKRGSGEAN